MEWSLLAAAVIVSIPWGLALYFAVYAGKARVDSLLDELDELEERADRAEDLLDDAKHLLADVAREGRDAIARRASLDAALRGAPAGGRVDAVARMLLAEQRARRGEGPTPGPAPPIAAPRPGSDGQPRADRV